MDGELPADFRCPISLELMIDPVILESGHTFDRSSIQRWLNSGHRTCPITKLPLSDHPSLIPNLALRSLISNFTGATLKKPNPQSKEPYLLFSALSSHVSSPELKLEYISTLVRRTKHDSFLRKQVMESCAVSSILDCVDSPLIQGKALSLILNLSLEDDNKVGLVADGVIRRLVRVIRAGYTSDSRAIACTVLTSLAVVEVNKVTIGAFPLAIESLVHLLDRGTGREVKEAATALYAICSFAENRRRAVENGAVPILVRLASTGMERAIEVLSVVSKSKEGVEEMAKVGGCVGVLADAVKSRGERGIQCSLATLSNLCWCCDKLCEEARGEGLLEVCVVLVNGDNEKIRRNAAVLLEALRGGCRR